MIIDVDIPILASVEWNGEIQAGDAVMNTEFSMFVAQRRDLLRLCRDGYLKLAEENSAKNEAWVLTNLGEETLQAYEDRTKAERAEQFG